MPVLNPVVKPGKPLHVSEDRIPMERLFKLSYMRHNLPDWELVYFEEGLEMPEIIERCKEYCSISHFRFLFVRKAIRRLE